MKNILSLSVLSLLLLVSLVAVPALAATVTCPSSCSCLLPAKAKELGYSVFCSGKQAVCGYDAAKNAKYCYEKPVTMSKVVPMTCPSTCTCLETKKYLEAGYQYCGGTQTVCGEDDLGNPLSCFEKTMTVEPVPCVKGCTCLDAAMVNVPGYRYCGGTKTLCDYDISKNPQYCFEKPVTPAPVPVKCLSTCTCTVPEKAEAAGLSVCGENRMFCGTTQSGTDQYCYTLAASVTTTPTTPVVRLATKPCTGTCTCLATDRAEAVGVKRCSGTSTPCDYDPMNRPMYCYVTDQVTKESPVSITPTAASAADDIARPADQPVIKTEQAPAPRDSFVGTIWSFIASFYRPKPVRCGEGGKICGDICINPLTDKNNCGECGNVCGPGEKCIDGACRDLTSDVQYCGETAMTCPDSWACCGGHCKNMREDEENCGGCGTLCDRGETCCDGDCVDTDVDLFHCGTCNRYCSASAGESCQEGQCVREDNSDDCGRAGIVCKWDEECCNGRCVGIKDDEDNCGGCGIGCLGAEECCGGQCADLTTDYLNCGRCNQGCYGLDACCDSHCVLLSGDENNCGRCGHTCPAGFECCSGECRNLKTDENNCGSCYHQCQWYQHDCNGGRCCLIGDLGCE